MWERSCLEETVTFNLHKIADQRESQNEAHFYLQAE